MSDDRAPDPAEDSAYRSLFRDEAPPAEPGLPATVEPAIEAEPVGAHEHSAAEPVDAEAVDAEAAGAEAAPPDAEPAPAPRAADRPELVDTGRLFRSSRVDGHAEALPAVSTAQAHRLRTLHEEPDAEPAPAAVLLAEPSEPAPIAPPATPGRASRTRPSIGLGGSMTSLGVAVVVGGVTLVVGLVDAFVGGPGLGPITGVALLLASIGAALRVRLQDAPVAVIAPSLAFFVAAITVGQIGQSVSSGLLSRAVIVFFTLAENWLWIIGATVAALLVVVVRSRQSR